MSHGRFVWYELMTSDADAAKAFYTEVIGWTTQPWEGSMDYTMFRVGQRSIGGLMELPDKAKEMGSPPHWLGHLQVTDIDATVARVNELGGKVLNPVQEVPEVGRFAIVADPQGAVSSLFCPASDMPVIAPEIGDFTWNELNTTDWEGAWKFYSELLDWKKTESMDMGSENGTYFMWKHAEGEDSMGGMSNFAKVQNIPPHWLFYVTVDDLDATAKRVVGKGGQVINGPMEVPGGDRVAICLDPQGVAFAIHWRNPNQQ